MRTDKLRERRIQSLVALLMAAVLIAAYCLFAPVSEAAIEPVISAKSALIYCDNTGETVYSKGEDKKMSPYSLTKLMTAMVAVMGGPLDKETKVTETAAGQPGTKVGLIPGETVTIEQLLYGALLESGNDAAYALAEATRKDVSRFIKKMNRTAKNIGCKNTHFSNPTGLTNDDNYSTAEDLALIARVAFEDSTIKKIIGSSEYLMKPTDKSGPREFKSHVKKYVDGQSIVAGKTGSDGTTCTAALEYRKNGLELIIVLLGDTYEGREEDARNLAEYAEDIIDGVVAVNANEKVGDVRIRHGAKTKLPVYTKETGMAYIPSEGSKSLVTTEYDIDDDVRAPIRAGAEVGTCKVMVGSDVVNEVPLVINESVRTGWPTSYLGISNNMAIVLGAVLAIMLILFLIILILRLYFKIKSKRIRRRKAMEVAKRELMEEEERDRRGWDM